MKLCFFVIACIFLIVLDGRVGNNNVPDSRWILDLVEYSASRSLFLFCSFFEGNMEGGM